MAHDPATGNMVLFGGAGSGGDLSDTWTWDGTTWTQQSPATRPAAREEATMAFDPATGNMVLFGGLGGGYLSDTWTWDGTDWTQQSPATSPPARNRAMMAFDPATGNMVLFGGVGSSGRLSDTWTWDGTNWTQREPGHQPLWLLGNDGVRPGGRKHGALRRLGARRISLLTPGPGTGPTGPS